MSTTTRVPLAPEGLLPQTAEPESPQGPADSRGAWPTRVLLATDGAASADAAVIAARGFARRAGATVEMLATYAPRIPLPASPERRGIARCAPSDRREVADLLRRVRAQRVRTLTDARDRREWPLRLEVGDPGPAIARVANEVAADLIVLGPPEPLTRDVYTGVGVARDATVPLLAVASDCELPVRCIAALPDGRLDARTLRAALGCMSPGGHLWLAIPAALPAGGAEVDRSESPRDLAARMCGPDSAVALSKLDVDRVEVPGDMLAGVLRLADEVRAQLIAVPNHGDPGPVRAFLPNLADPVLLGARCSVLVVPDQTAGAADTSAP